MAGWFRRERRSSSGVGPPPPGSARYAELVENEIEHYSRVFQDERAKERLFQPVPQVWLEIEERAKTVTRAMTGADAVKHLTDRLQARPGVRMLSLGSGPGGLEISCAEVSPAQIVCIDVNEELLEIGRARAAEVGVTIRFEQGDLNTIDLPPTAYDIVFCHASLHHVIELERLGDQIRRTLRSDGELLVVDVITDNGYRMWPEHSRCGQSHLPNASRPAPCQLHGVCRATRGRGDLGGGHERGVDGVHPLEGHPRRSRVEVRDDGVRALLQHLEALLRHDVRAGL